MLLQLLIILYMKLIETFSHYYLVFSSIGCSHHFIVLDKLRSSHTKYNFSATIGRSISKKNYIMYIFYIYISIYIYIDI